MTLELKRHLLFPYSFILHKKSLKESQCSIPSQPQMAEKCTFQFPWLECTDAQENIKSLQSSHEIHVTGSKFVPLSHHKSK
jgi:hypothetical protein